MTRLAKSLRSSEPLPLAHSPVWGSVGGLPTHTEVAIGTREVVSQDGSGASVDMEITDGSFHASFFVAMRQL